VGVVAIGAGTKDDGVLRRELVVEAGEGLDLGRADEGEVAGVKEEHEPFAPVVGETDGPGLGLVADVRRRRHIRSGFTHEECHFCLSLSLP
jgi:hypothetical protein